MLHDHIRPDTLVLIENIQSVSGIELTVLDKDGKPNIRHESDMMVMYKHAAFPTLVIEVSHPQKKKALVDKVRLNGFCTHAQLASGARLLVSATRWCIIRHTE
jgi:hypothetical protein